LLRTVLDILAVVAIKVEMRGKKGRHALAQLSLPRLLRINYCVNTTNQFTPLIKILKYVPVLILFKPKWDVVSAEGVRHMRISEVIVLAADLLSLHGVAEARKVGVRSSILR
jgi:hypothetical protein